MARLAAVLKAAATAVWRERRSLFSFTANNFFVTIIFFFREYQAGIPFYLLLMVVLLFPLSADPLQKLPPERLALWPLTRMELWVLRMTAPWLNPLTWLLAALVLWSALHRDLQTAGIAALVMIAILLLAPLMPQAGRTSIWRSVPRFPGFLGQIVRKDVRQILSTLDFVLAAFLSAAFVAYRLAVGSLPEEAHTAFSLLIVVALSTVTQTLFALDGRQGLTRYHLLPLAGWQVLAAKAVAWLTVVAVLTAPASITSGMAAGLAALAFGCWASVRSMTPQRRWRFATSPSGVNSIMLVIALLIVGVAVLRASAWWILPAGMAAIISIAVSGRCFDHAQASFR